MENAANVIDFNNLNGKDLQERITENSIDYVLHTCDEYLNHLVMLGESIYDNKDFNEKAPDFKTIFGDSPKTTQFDIDLTKPHDYEETLLKLQFSIISLLKEMIQALKSAGYSSKSPVGLKGAVWHLTKPGLKAKKYSEQLDELQNNLNKLSKTQNRNPAHMQNLALCIWNENQVFLAALVKHNGVFNFMVKPGMIRDDLAIQHTHINATMDQTLAWYKDYTFKEAQVKYKSLQTATEELVKTEITPKTKLNALAKQTQSLIREIEGLHNKAKSLRGNIEAKIEETKQQAEPLKREELIKRTEKLQANLRPLTLKYIHMSIDELEQRSEDISSHPMSEDTKNKLIKIKKHFYESDDLSIPFGEIYNLDIRSEELAKLSDISLENIASNQTQQIEHQIKFDKEHQARKGIDKISGFFKDGFNSIKHAAHHYNEDEKAIFKNKQIMLTNINNKLAEAEYPNLITSVIKAKQQLDTHHSIDGNSKTSHTLRELRCQLEVVDSWLKAHEAWIKDLGDFQLKIDLHKNTYLAIAVKGIALALVTLIFTFGGALAGSLIEPGAGTLMGVFVGAFLAASVIRQATGSAASVSSGTSGASNSTQEMIEKDEGMKPGSENKNENGNDKANELNSGNDKHGENPAGLNSVKGGNDENNMEGGPPQLLKIDSNPNVLAN